MKGKSYFWLFVGTLWLIPTAEVKSQETRRLPITPVGQVGPQSRTMGKTNVAAFDHAYALAMNLASKELFLGTDAGLFRSANGGRTWAKLPLSANQATFNVTAVVLDPNQPRTIYVATREAGVFINPDGGTNWKPINDGLAGLEVHGLAVDPNDGKLHAVVKNKGQQIYRSTNAGGKWSRVNGGPGKEITFLSSVNIPTGMGGIFLYAGTGEGLYRTADCF